jgi:hypothetical protein
MHPGPAAKDTSHHLKEDLVDSQTVTSNNVFWEAFDESVFL